MSVRREAVSDHSGRGTGLMKNALFWMAMLTASFLLGFLVIAPLMQLTRGKSDSSSTSSPPQNNNPKQPLSSAHTTVPQERRKVNKEPDEPVNITPDRSSQPDSAVQPAGDPTESTDRTGRSSEGVGAAGASEADRGTSAEGPGASRSDAPADSGLSDRSRRRESASQDSSSEATRRGRRSGRDRDEAPSRRSTRSDDDSTIQRGESIDR